MTDSVAAVILLRHDGAALLVKSNLPARTLCSPVFLAKERLQT